MNNEPCTIKGYDLAPKARKVYIFTMLVLVVVMGASLVADVPKVVKALVSFLAYSMVLTSVAPQMKIWVNKSE